MSYNPEWLRLQIHWPRGEHGITPPPHGGAAHKLAAKAVAACEGDRRCAVPSELFHHETHEDGSRGPKNGLSPFRFAAGKSGMSVTAVGDDAVDVLESCGHRLTRAISAMAGQPLRETFQRGELRLAQDSKRLQHYRMDYGVLARGSIHKLPVGQDLAAGKMTPEVRAWVAKRILDGIARQAALVGLPEPEDSLLRVIEIEGTLPWYRDDNYQGCVARGVTFASDIYLAGPWSVGALCLIGEGRLRSVRAEEAEQASAA